MKKVVYLFISAILIFFFFISGSSWSFTNIHPIASIIFVVVLAVLLAYFGDMIFGDSTKPNQEDPEK